MISTLESYYPEVSTNIYRILRLMKKKVTDQEKTWVYIDFESSNHSQCAMDIPRSLEGDFDND
jgi:hypothetical protein